MRRVRTTCRICESRCGVIVEVQGDRAERIIPDPDHPVSRGYACAKGLGFAAVHYNQGRLLRPHLGGLEVPWEKALSALGAKLAAIADDHGPQSVAIYSGNAVGQSLGAIVGVSAFQEGLGQARHYSALTLDNADQIVVLEAVTGSPMHSFAADFAHSDVVVLFGTDMLTSQPAQSQSNPMGIGHLHRVAREGGLWVLDPRRSRTAAKGHHLAIQPGGDLPVLAWLVREALARGVDDTRVRPGDLQALQAALAPFDLARAASAAGLAAEALEELRHALMSAERPCVWSGLGVLLGPDGTLGYWLTLILQLTLGGLEAPGGWRTPPGTVNMGALARRLGVVAVDSNLRGRHGHLATLGTLPSADLAEDILAGDVRALVVVGGNPALSLPDHRRAVDALRHLELLVCVDLFTNDTGTLAHGRLPARSWLARDDVPLHLAGQRWAGGMPQVVPLEPAAVPPLGEAREDLHILLDLTRAAGFSAFGSRMAHAALRGLSSSTLGRLGSRAAALLGPARPLGRTHHPDGHVHLAIPDFLDALASWRPRPRALRLVTSARSTETMNHWLHGSRAAQRRRPVATMHPETAAERGVTEGRVRLRGASEIEVTLTFDPALARGVVVLPYGWGHLPGAADSGGVSANTLVRSDHREPFTGQPVSNGQPVEVTQAEDAPQKS